MEALVSQDAEVWIDLKLTEEKLEATRRLLEASRREALSLGIQRRCAQKALVVAEGLYERSGYSAAKEIVDALQEALA